MQASQGPDPAKLSALARALQNLSDPARGPDPDLPDEVSRFLEGLSDEERNTLMKTHEAMISAGMAYDLPDGGKLGFL